MIRTDDSESAADTHGFRYRLGGGDRDVFCTPKQGLAVHAARLERDPRAVLVDQRGNNTLPVVVILDFETSGGVQTTDSDSPFFPNEVLRVRRSQQNKKGER